MSPVSLKIIASIISSLTRLCGWRSLLVMQVDSINGKPVTSVTFDTLQALSKVTVTASIRDINGVVQDINSDSALVTIFDAEPTDSVYDSGVVGGFWQHSMTFLMPGAIIYKGDNTIHNGRVSATFIIPKDISYENKQGKVSVYFLGNGMDGRGYTDQVIVEQRPPWLRTIHRGRQKNIS